MRWSTWSLGAGCCPRRMAVRRGTRGPIPRAATRRISACGERTRRWGTARRRRAGRARGSSCSRWWSNRGWMRPRRGGEAGAWPRHVRLRTPGWYESSSWVSCCAFWRAWIARCAIGCAAGDWLCLSRIGSRERGLGALTWSTRQTGYSTEYARRQRFRQRLRSLHRSLVDSAMIRGQTPPRSGAIADVQTGGRV